METLEMKMFISEDSLPKNESKGRPVVINQSENMISEQINFHITDDVDDEAVYGKNRQRHKSRER
jgi:hypothetical protein